ncbi:MAG TPA: peptidylprolyl isomerase [Bryobacteraceae bacterium]|nr:peptidylprolyl isomerase [Bryobacteraceae bacterium]
MKALLVSILLCSALLAQAPASKRAAKRAPAARPSLMNPASLRARAPEDFKAQFTTTKGDFVVEVHRDWSPLGADRFYNLVRAGYFTNAAFFRVVPNFMVQFGLSANPAINKAWEHANLHDDPSKGISNKRGYITFAKTGAPNSRSTQVYINFKDNAFLDSQGFTPFGEVVEGMDTVVDKISSAYGERPDQGRITDEGDAYITKNFPNIDKIKLAKVLPAAAAADKK